jgi:arylsulfatase
VKKERKMPDDAREQDRHETSLNQTEDRAPSRRNILLGSSALVAAATMTSGALAQAQKAAPDASTAPSGRKPNILVIFGDDIGQTNVSAYSFGLMGYRTPNIDRIAKEGMMFTDYYAEQSCTAGRSSFITGQCRFVRVFRR